MLLVLGKMGGRCLAILGSGIVYDGATLSGAVQPGIASTTSSLASSFPSVLAREMPVAPPVLMPRRTFRTSQYAQNLSSYLFLPRPFPSFPRSIIFIFFQLSVHRLWSRAPRRGDARTAVSMISRPLLLRPNLPGVRLELYVKLSPAIRDSISATRYVGPLQVVQLSIPPLDHDLSQTVQSRVILSSCYVDLVALETS
ncbi:hypothetical protein F5878DRAFT_46789 [Lentinula raphanica]|uniref:Uncharacterized protein n=1 Tax=Lentinula raphanica TaxID=153919 RepID=A0AA38U409_9AGAR|nr:hypothetical protein F5878DRAFT_46789 [Lentinula raphanica]